MPTHYNPALRRSPLRGTVEIERVVEAVNSISDEVRPTVVAALKVSVPHVRWITLRDGSLSVA